VQPGQVGGQFAQGVAGEVEDFQRVGEFKNLGRKFGQPARQRQPLAARQLSGA
jgi:hypothetical protein